MSSKRKPGQPMSSSNLNFRPTQDKNEPKGTKPTVEKFTVRNVILMMVQHCCRKLLFFDIKLRVFAYLAFIFFFSVIVDVIPLPKALQVSLAHKNGFFNSYFVKVGWGWTLLLGLPFSLCTSFISNCGNKLKVWRHLGRYVVATFFWYFWTNMFLYIEGTFGKCNSNKLHSKFTCSSQGFFWQGIDISGHCFILLYSSLLLIEECRVINGWEGIADIIREEDYSRTVEGGSNIASQLRTLSDDEFEKLKAAYPKLTPVIRTCFILITVLIIIWDCMLISTVIFYHNMVEKVIAAFAAVLTWYVTYYLWFSSPILLPPAPGEGLFRYKAEAKLSQSTNLKKKPSYNNKITGRRFMGMPLRVPEEPKSNTAQPDERT